MARIFFLVGTALLVGTMTGYAAGYLGRLVHIAFLEAAIVGMLGASLLLFLALFTQAPPRGWVPLACIMLGLGGWLGNQLNDYRYTRQQLTRKGLDPGLQSISVNDFELLTTPEQRARLQNDAMLVFQDALAQRTGSSGLWGFVKLKWQQGLIISRFGDHTVRGAVPPYLVAASQAFSIVLSVLLAWLVLKRISWALQCVSCGRYISRQAPKDQDEDDASETWDPSAAAEETELTDEELTELALSPEEETRGPLCCPYCEAVQP